MLRKVKYIYKVKENSNVKQTRGLRIAYKIESKATLYWSQKIEAILAVTWSWALVTEKQGKVQGEMSCPKSLSS